MFAILKNLNPFARKASCFTSAAIIGMPLAALILAAVTFLPGWAWQWGFAIVVICVVCVLVLALSGYAWHQMKEARLYIRTHGYAAWKFRRARLRFEQAKSDFHDATEKAQRRASYRRASRRRAQVIAFYHLHVPFTLKRRWARLRHQAGQYASTTVRRAGEGAWLRTGLITKGFLLFMAANWLAMSYHVVFIKGAEVTFGSALFGTLILAFLAWLPIYTGWNILDKRPQPARPQRKLAALMVTLIPMWINLMATGGGAAKLLYTSFGFGLAAGVLGFIYECGDEPFLERFRFRRKSGLNA